eukprot:8182285-Alexandrium_andersonii.AAC.1
MKGGPSHPHNISALGKEWRSHEWRSVDRQEVPTDRRYPPALVIIITTCAHNEESVSSRVPK